MPTINTEDLAALRDQSQWSRFYLGVLVPETVHTSQINYVNIPRGTVAIPFDGGAYAAGFAAGDVVAGMTLWVGTTANSHDICKLRIRTPYNRTCTAGNAFSSGDGGVTGTITVCEHNYLLQDNYHLTVKEEFRLWPRHAIAVQGGLNVLRYNDYDIQYCGQNRDVNRDPIVRMGPPGVAIRDAAGNATVNFWSDSGAAPGGSVPSSYAWAWRGGTPASAATAGTAGSPHEVVWTVPGFYLATLTLNGDISGYRPVFIYDPAGSNRPYESFEIESVSGDFSTGGWRMAVRMKEECAEADFPEESMIILWADDWYKGSQVSMGGNYRHREQIIFVGYITRGTIRKDPFTNDVLFEAHTMDGEMKGCEQFPLSVEDHPTANNDWLQIQDMTVDKVAYFIAKWQSTLLDITDVHFSGDDKLVRWFDIAQKSLYEQLDRDCYNSAILGRCLSDRTSLVRCEINPQFLDVGADRNAIDVIMGIQEQDWRDQIEIPSPQPPRTALVDLSAGSYAGNLADVALIFSLAHGDVPMERGRSIQLDNLIGEDQNQCNRVAGNYLANQNNPYPNIRVPIGLNYRVFDIVPQEWVTMSLAASDTYRGITWTDERLIPRTINFNLENTIGALNVDLNLEMESSGTAGVAGYYPTEPPEDDYTPPPPPEPPPFTPVVDDMMGIWVVGCHGSHLGTTPCILRTEEMGGYTDSSPTWSEWNTGMYGYAEGYRYCRALGRDPWHPKERIYALVSDKSIVLDVDAHDEGKALCRREYSGGAWGNWTTILDWATIQATVGYSITAGTDNIGISRMSSNINHNGHLYVLVACSVLDASPSWHNLHFFKSTNYGDNWTDMGAVFGGIYIRCIPIAVRAGMLQGTSGFGAGQVIYGSYRVRNIWHYPQIIVSRDQGTTWLYVGGGTNVDEKGVRIMVDPNDQSILYAIEGHDYDVDGDIWRYTGDGAAGGELAAWGTCTRAVVTKSGEATVQMAAGGTELKYSVNGGATVNNISVDGNIAGGGLWVNWNTQRLRAIHSYANGLNGTRYFQVSSDGGITWHNKHGNMAGNFRGLVNTGLSLDN